MSETLGVMVLAWLGRKAKLSLPASSLENRPATKRFTLPAVFPAFLAALLNPVRITLPPRPLVFAEVVVASSPALESVAA